MSAHGWLALAIALMALAILFLWALFPVGVVLAVQAIAVLVKWETVRHG